MYRQVAVPPLGVCNILKHEVLAAPGGRPAHHFLAHAPPQPTVRIAVQAGLHAAFGTVMALLYKHRLGASLQGGGGQV